MDLPVGTPIGSWFDVLNTSDGQQIAHLLGPRSGFFAEYQNWAPLVCHLFDFTVHTANLGLSMEISAESRLLIEPLAIVLGKLLELGVVILEQRRLQADHAGTPLEHAWKTLATAVRISSAQEKYTSKLGGETADKLREQVQKSSLRAQADRTEASHRRDNAGFSAGGSSRQNRGRVRGRGRHGGRGGNLGGFNGGSDSAGAGASSSNPFSDA